MLLATRHDSVWNVAHRLRALYLPACRPGMHAESGYDDAPHWHHAVAMARTIS